MTIDETIEILEIFKKYQILDKSWWISGAEHDVIYSVFDTDYIPESSDDGKRLQQLGWCIDEYDTWVLYV